MISEIEARLRFLEQKTDRLFSKANSLRDRVGQFSQDVSMTTCGQQAGGGNPLYRGHIYGCAGLPLTGIVVTFYPISKDPSTGNYYEYSSPRTANTDSSGYFAFSDLPTPGTIDGQYAYGFEFYQLSDLTHQPTYTWWQTANNNVTVTLEPSAGYECWSPCGPLAYKYPRITDYNGSVSTSGNYGYPLSIGGFSRTTHMQADYTSCWKHYGNWSHYVKDKPGYGYYLTGDVLTIVAWKYSATPYGADYVAIDNYVKPDELWADNSWATYGAFPPTFAYQRANNSYNAGHNPGIVWQDSSGVTKTCGTSPTWTFTFASGGVASDLGISTVTLTPTP